MGLIRDGIDRVRALELAGGIWTDGECVPAVRRALVRWWSQWTDKLHQVYVDGSYAGTTVEFGQRELLVAVPNVPGQAVRIEVFAVEPSEAHVDFSGQLEPSKTDHGRVRIMVLRSQELGLGARLEIYGDGGSGQIDYSEPVEGGVVEVWPIRQEKAGFGLAGFGCGDFGFEGCGAVGFGRGVFGEGEFGFGADTIEWVSGVLGAGRWRFGIRVVDSLGRAGEPVEVGPVTVVPGAEPAERLVVSSFEPASGELVLGIS